MFKKHNKDKIYVKFSWLKNSIILEITTVFVKFQSRQSKYDNILTMKKEYSSLNEIHYILLAMVMVIGIIIRFWGLGDKSLWMMKSFHIWFRHRKAF